jgi:hypothetical protein
MTEPLSLTVGSITALAFSTFLQSTTKEAAKKLATGTIEKINDLRMQIWSKLRGTPEVDQLQADIEKKKQVTEEQIRLLTLYLEPAMAEDNKFSQQIQKTAYEINQEVNIDDVIGQNVQNVYGGSAVQITDPDAPVFTGDISNSPMTFNITNH